MCVCVGEGGCMYGSGRCICTQKSVCVYGGEIQLHVVSASNCLADDQL